MVTQVEWIESAGGPLLLAPRSSIRDWLGVDGSKVAGLQTDYERACSIQAEIGIIPVGSRSAVVLGDEPDRTALLPVKSSSEVLMERCIAGVVRGNTGCVHRQSLRSSNDEDRDCSDRTGCVL